MAVEAAGADIPNWIVALGVGLGSAIISGFSGFLVGLVNRGPAMQLAINAAFEPLLEGYKARVSELIAEIHTLRYEVKELQEALTTAKQELHLARTNDTPTGFGV